MERAMYGQTNGRENYTHDNIQLYIQQFPNNFNNLYKNDPTLYKNDPMTKTEY